MQNQNEKKYKFKHNVPSNGINFNATEEELTISELLERIKTYPYYYEMIMNECVPFFDIDIKTKQVLCDDDIRKLEKLIVKVFNSIVDDDENVYFARSHGNIEHKEYTYKFSMHIVIREKYYYSCGKAVQQKYEKLINDELQKRLNKTEFDSDEITEIKIDPSVYKQQDKKQLMRTLYSMKLDDKYKRVMMPFERSTGSTRKLTLQRFMISNLGKCELDPIELIDESKKIIKETKQIENKIKNKSENKINENKTNENRSENKTNENDIYQYMIEDEKQTDDEIEELLIDHFYELHTSATNPKMKTINDYTLIEFRNTQKDTCLICDRQHSSNRNYITYHPEKRVAFYKCHDDDAKDKKIILFGKRPDNIDEKKLIELKESINNCFDEEEYYFTDFTNYYNGKKFKSEKGMIDEIHPKISRVIAKIAQGRGLYIKKIAKDNMYDFDDTLGQINNIKLQYKQDDKYVKITLKDFINSYCVTFNRHVCELDTDKVDKREFNICKPFICKMTEQKDEKKLEVFLSYIREVLADNNDELMAYILSWLASLMDVKVVNNGVAMVLISEQEGTGKSTLADFITNYLIGIDHATNLPCINDVVKSHNPHLQGKRLILVNEMGSTKEEFRSNFDKIKDYITNHRININPKHANPYEIANISNYILCSNNRDSLYLSDTARRYFILEVNPKYALNDVYYGKLRKECFNQEFGNIFYTYLMNYNRVNLRQVPTTKLKQEIISLSMPSYKKFINDIVEYRDCEEKSESGLCSLSSVIVNSIQKGDDLLISAKKLYDSYIQWCEETGERNKVSLSKLGLSLNRDWKKRVSSSVMYCVNKFEKY